MTAPETRRCPGRSPAIAYDYRDGGNRVDMHYDVVQHGPGIGAAFSF